MGNFSEQGLVITPDLVVGVGGCDGLILPARVARPGRVFWISIHRIARALKCLYNVAIF